MDQFRLLNIGVLGVILPAPCFAQSATPPTSPIVGTWILESIVDTLPDGSLFYWMGEHPSGAIMYDATGHMAVQFMRDPRPSIAGGDIERATPAELRDIYDGYYAYFGKYELNARGDSVTHYVETSLRPDEVGIVYRRAARVEGDRLIIRLNFTAGNGFLHKRLLSWTRAR